MHAVNAVINALNAVIPCMCLSVCLFVSLSVCVPLGVCVCVCVSGCPLASDRMCVHGRRSHPPTLMHMQLGLFVWIDRSRPPQGKYVCVCVC